ncbi:hypothetical protein BJV74DRAFT_884865 [Russula compacta]|nr:hypothetical protein BJV74DRAFT_884865 [Russula compacta]
MLSAVLLPPCKPPCDTGGAGTVTIPKQDFKDTQAAVVLLNLAGTTEDMASGWNGNDNEVEEDFRVSDGDGEDNKDIASLVNSLHEINMGNILDDEDDGISQIPLQIPVCGALNNLEFSSDILWTAFCTMVSNKMDIPELKLDIAYKLMTEPKGDLPHCLSTARHLLQLITMANQHLSGAIKRGSKRPFSVIIVDKSPKDVGKKASNKGNSKTLKHKKEDSDDEDEDGNPEVKSMFSSNGKIITTLKLKYGCDEHSQKHYWVMQNGEHHQLTKANLALWALMILRSLLLQYCVSMTYYALEDAPPPSQISMKSRKEGPMLGYPLNYLLSPPHFMPHGMYPYLGGFLYYPQGFGLAERPPVKSMEDPAVNNPALSPSSYVQYFRDNRIQHIFKIANSTLFSCNDILAICPGMKVGTANLLLKYAHEDVEAIHNEEQQ